MSDDSQHERTQVGVITSRDGTQHIVPVNHPNETLKIFREVLPGEVTITREELKSALMKIWEPMGLGNRWPIVSVVKALQAELFPEGNERPVTEKP